MKAVVCLPTYNEAENLEPMVRALGEVLPDGGRVLVIDDDSPDGTGAIADRLAAELEWVDVLHRERKEGLGRAYVAGFERALADGAELVLEIDCDFSHDPQDVPRLIAAVEAGADLALGSRYVPGGGTANWGLLRRAISRGASIYTRTLLMPVHDATGGFKCFRSRVLESIDLDRIDAAGYVFQIETT
ncbi:MAG: polyprenol monophosphomannose synthase, partial [Gaiellaceae bacterium]